MSEKPTDATHLSLNILKVIGLSIFLIAGTNRATIWWYEGEIEDLEKDHTEEVQKVQEAFHDATRDADREILLNAIEDNAALIMANHTEITRRLENKTGRLSQQIRVLADFHNIKLAEE